LADGKIIKSLSLVGMAESSSNFKNLDDECWTYLNSYKPLTKDWPDKHFITHRQVFNLINGATKFNWKEINSLKDEGCQLISLHKIDTLNADIYPLKEIIEKFNTTYFASTHAYVLAYALHLSTVKEKGKLRLGNFYYSPINLFGWDMTNLSEYMYDRFGMEYWIGIAKGLGIEIWYPKGSGICETYTGYPYAMVETQA